MFDPVDKKRPDARRSLLDLASADGGAKKASGMPHPQARSLLDQLTAETGRAATARPARARAADFAAERGVPMKTADHAPQQQANERDHQNRPSARGNRLSRWLGADAGSADQSHVSGRDRLDDAVESLPETAEMRRSDFDPARAPSAQGDRPLIDIGLIVSSVWQLRKLILATTVLGAVGGVLLAMSTPSIYIAESKLYVDPREIRLTDSDLSKASLATEAILALVDSQLEVLRSRTVLEKVAADLGLDRDAEFGQVATGAGAIATGIGVVRDLVSRPATNEPEPVAASGVNARTLENLSDAVTVARDPKTFIVTVYVETKDPAKSALIANRIVTTFLNEESAAQAGFFQRTTAALDSRLADLRKELDTAENAVEKYKADNDIVGASGELISDKQLLALNDQVGIVRSRIADARAKADVATRIQLNDVLSGAYPEELGSATLAELRKQYSSARAQLSALETSLGPRHPQRLAAAQSLEAARNEIGNELRRIAATTRTELDRAVRTEADLVQQLAVQKSRQVNSSQDLVALRELERKAAATRTIYESFLKRASETGQEEKLTSKNIRVISSAEPPLQPEGPSRKLIAIGGMMAGLFGGLGLGMMLGIYRSMRQTITRTGGRQEPVPERDPPGRGHRIEEDQAVAEAPIKARVLERTMTRSPVPSSHHAQAAVAARHAAPAPFHAHELEENGGDIAQVRDDLRALRSRVEFYARQKAVGRR